ncbi:MAG: diadenylate cyclase [Gemmataceae bacterium]|nr:diadenylate cyclase [Planctomycetota bacterium]MSR48991.1 diadenylate cyclase [Gemmataceae bacterium]
MYERILHTWEMLDARAVVQIAILAVAIFFLLQFLGRSRGMGVVRAFGLVVVGIFLSAQILVSIFNLTVVGRILDYLLATMLLALLVIFQPELRRGLMWLGKYGVLYAITSSSKRPIVDKLSDAAEVLAGQFVGALIAVEREIPLTVYVETGTRVDAEVSPLLIRAIFQKQSPLHDGAMIVSNGRIVAAGCQLPLSPIEVSSKNLHGMRHRAALGTSEETDAILLVVSEETGRITLASAGKLEVVPRENLSRRLAELLESNSSYVRPTKATIPENQESDRVA